MFLFSDDYLNTEKRFDKLNLNESSITRHKITHHVPVTIKIIRLFFLKKQKNNFREMKYVSDGFDQDGFKEKGFDIQGFDRNKFNVFGFKKDKHLLDNQGNVLQALGKSPSNIS